MCRRYLEGGSVSSAVCRVSPSRVWVGVFRFGMCQLILVGVSSSWYVGDIAKEMGCVYGGGGGGLSISLLRSLSPPLFFPLSRSFPLELWVRGERRQDCIYSSVLSSFFRNWLLMSLR